jgi:predicted lipoprotein
MASEARFERFVFWPDPHGTGARQLRQMLASENQELLAPGALQKQSAAVQGVPALEGALYSGKDALLSTDSPPEYRCALALAIARNMNAIAALASFGWSGDDSFVNTMLKPGPDNIYYATEIEPLTEIVRAILLGVEQDRDLKILPGLGDSIDQAKPGKVLFATSGLSGSYLKDSLASLKSFVEVSNVFSLLPEADKDLAAAYQSGMTTAETEIQAAGDDFKAAVSDPEKRKHLEAAMDALATLRDLFHFKIAPKLGIPSGFNALDGD